MFFSWNRVEKVCSVVHYYTLLHYEISGLSKLVCEDSQHIGIITIIRIMIIAREMTNNLVSGFYKNTERILCPVRLESQASLRLPESGSCSTSFQTVRVSCGCSTSSTVDSISLHLIGARDCGDT